MNCHYHPAVAAQNYCRHCSDYFCSKCSDAVSIMQNAPPSVSCFVCGGELEPLPLSRDNSIEPFWSRICEVYKYPVSSQPLMTIVVVALLSLMLQSFGLLSLMPIVVINLYSFICLRQTANGETNARAIEARLEGSLAPVFYVLLSSVIAIFVTVIVFDNIDNGIGAITNVALVMTVPVVIILIAVDEQLLPVLNRARLIELISTTGTSYFIMVLFIIIMTVSIEILIARFGNTNFQSFSTFLSALCFSYYNIVMFHITVYVVYKNHIQLSYRESTNDRARSTKARSPSQRRTAQLELLIKAGLYDAAREVVARIIKRGAQTWEWERAFSLYCAAKPSRNLAVFFPRYLDKLIEENEYQKIAEGYIELMRVEPDFDIADDHHKLEIAAALHQIGKHVKAIRLIQKLPSESQDQDVVGGALELLSNCFKYVPGGERSAGNFQTMHALHLSKKRP